MGHYCWVCRRARANETFSGKGHKRHICRECARLPREERERIQAIRDIEGFLRQRNISAKNLARLRSLCNSADDKIRQTATLVLEVARVKPHRRGRRAYLAGHRPDLLSQLARLGLLDEYTDVSGCVSEADEGASVEFCDDELSF